jgi:hypothetical protein
VLDIDYPAIIMGIFPYADSVKPDNIFFDKYIVSIDPKKFRIIPAQATICQKLGWSVENIAYDQKTDMMEIRL